MRSSLSRTVLLTWLCASIGCFCSLTHAIAGDQEIEAWTKARDSNDAEQLDAYLAEFPNGTFAPLARIRLQKHNKSKEADSERDTRPSPVFSDSGNSLYLQAKRAWNEYRYADAAKLYDKILEQHTPTDKVFDRALTAHAILGDWERAIPLAQSVLSKRPTNRIAAHVLATEAFLNGDYPRTRTLCKRTNKSPIGQLVYNLSTAWTYAAQRKQKRARATLMIKDPPKWAVYYYTYHRALIALVKKQTKTARKEFLALTKAGQSAMRSSLVAAQFFYTKGEADKALSLLDGSSLKKRPRHPSVVAMRKSIEAEQSVPLLISNATEGLAEVFYEIGSALRDEGGTTLGVVYLQLATKLRPDFDLAWTEIGDAMDRSGQHQEAIRVWDRIPNTSPLWHRVQILKSTSYRALGDKDSAVKILAALLDEDPEDRLALEGLADTLRAQKKYADAIKIYSQIIDKLSRSSKSDWSLYYKRGASFERLGNWDSAEQDLKAALKRDPKQPLVLNYLGFSLVDRDKDLRRGLALIKKAHDLKPEDGYIVDSLGWAFYKLGDHRRALGYFETAVSIQPSDPVILEHFGNAQWQIGRKSDAKQSWTKALRVAKEKEQRANLQQKIEQGLGQRSDESQ